MSGLEEFNRQFATFIKENPHVIVSQSIPENAKAVVVLSPVSLHHGFPRQWVTKGYKSTIVERPERMLAASIGIAAAVSMYPSLYTLLSSTRQASLLSSHVTKIHGRQWPLKLIQLVEECPDKLAREEIEVPPEWNSGDIYLNPETIHVLQGVVGALETAVDTILARGGPNRAFVAIRPPGHHSHRCAPSGFCLINNAQIAIEYAHEKHNVTHAVILDFDLHHGDGSQDICWKRAGWKSDEDNEETGFDEYGKKFAALPKVGYFSLHDINSYPTEVGYASPENIKNASTCIMAHDLNIWNVHLQPYETPEEFDKLYSSKYRQIFTKADEYLKRARAEYANSKSRDNKRPFKAIVVISAGFDASEFEQNSMQRHEVNVPTSFYNTFTRDALKLAHMHADGKLISVMEGGYSDGAISSGVFSHLIGLQNQNWMAEWGSEGVVKELVKGCKKSWKPHKSRKKEEVVRRWAEDVIKLGRCMIPDFNSVLFNEYAQKKDADFVIPRLTRSRAQMLKIDQATVIQRTDTPTPPPKIEEDEDSDDERMEELNKSFNKTVEDITIDDISRHLSHLDIENTGKNVRTSRILNFDDSDISMISHMSVVREKFR